MADYLTIEWTDHAFNITFGWDGAGAVDVDIEDYH